MTQSPYRPSGWQTLQVDARTVLELLNRMTAVERYLRHIERKIDLLGVEEDGDDEASYSPEDRSQHW